MAERSAFFWGDIADIGEGGDAARKVRGVVVVLAMIGDLAFERRSHVGSVALDVDAVRGDVSEGMQGLLFAFLEKVAGKREMGTEFDESGDHGQWSTEAV